WIIDCATTAADQATSAMPSSLTSPMLLLKAASRAHCPAKHWCFAVWKSGLEGGSEPCVPFFSWEWSDPSDQFFSFVSVGDFVNCANPSSVDFTCSAYGPFGSNCKHLW